MKVLIGDLSLCVQIGQSEQSLDLSVDASLKTLATLQP
jgi:hypothetical protein